MTRTERAKAFYAAWEAFNKQLVELFGVGKNNERLLRFKTDRKGNMIIALSIRIIDDKPDPAPAPEASP